MINYTKQTYSMYKVHILNNKTGRTHDSYIIKIPDGTLQETWEGIEKKLKDSLPLASFTVSIIDHE